MNEQRRSILNAAVAASAAVLLGRNATPAAAREPAPGKPGDFDFLAGEWRIENRRLPQGTKTWDVFPGEATVVTILAGAGSVEDLRIPARNFAGMGLRLLDMEKRHWTDHWVNAKSGVLTLPGQTGRFENGVGTFNADDMDGTTPIKIAGIWDQITPKSCRWRQAVSRDGGKSWAENWIMHWTRV
jgi:hypothetical protein